MFLISTIVFAGVDAFKTALEQWEKAGIVLESSEL